MPRHYFIKVLNPPLPENVELRIHNNTGIAEIADGRHGSAHTCHPSIDSTGSITGMKNKGYWRKDARTRRAFGCIFNIDSLVSTDDLDDLAMKHCVCDACQVRRLKAHAMGEDA